MRLLAYDITYLSVGSHFDASMLPCPLFGKRDKAAADPHLPKRLVDIAPFEVADVFGIAIFYMRSYAGLEKTAQPAVTGIGYDYQLRFGILNDIDHFILMVLLARPIPKLLPQAQPFGQIALAKRPDRESGPIRH